MTSSLTIALSTKEIKPGDTLRVEIAFDYLCASATSVTVWAWLALMQTPMPVGRDMESFTIVNLPAAPVKQTWTGSVDIEIPASGKKDGLYQLGVELMGTGLEKKEDNAVQLTGMPEETSIWEMIPMLMVVMMMGMMMSMMEEV